MKYLLLLLLVVCIPSSATKWECVRWTWKGDVYNRTVTCIEWRDKDLREKKK
jgi:hypothetical protein